MPEGTPPWQDNTLVFIGGVHRSGTSQLHETLAAHPDVSGFHDTGVPHDEGQHLQDVFPTARSHGGPGRFAFDPAAHLTESSPLASVESAERLFAQWSRYWDLRRNVLVEKSPPNLIRTRFLQRLFPGARFVIIVRHPLVTALATTKLATTRTMRRTLRRASMVDVLRHWVAAHQLFLSDLPHIENVRVLRWEDLSRDPVGTLREVATFLGVDGAFEIPVLDPGVDERYLQSWQDRLARRSGLHRPITRLLDEVYSHEPEANRFGYSLRDPASITPLTLNGAGTVG